MRAARTSAVLALALLATVAGAQSGPSLLITPRELAASLDNPNVVVLHVGPKPDYDAGHIRGARFVQMQDLADAGPGSAAGRGRAQPRAA